MSSLRSLDISPVAVLKCLSCAILHFSGPTVMELLYFGGGTFSWLFMFMILCWSLSVQRVFAVILGVNSWSCLCRVGLLSFNCCCPLWILGGCRFTGTEHFCRLVVSRKEWRWTRKRG